MNCWFVGDLKLSLKKIAWRRTRCGWPLFCFATCSWCSSTLTKFKSFRRRHRRLLLVIEVNTSASVSTPQQPISITLVSRMFPGLHCSISIGIFNKFSLEIRISFQHFNQNWMATHITFTLNSNCNFHARKSEIIINISSWILINCIYIDFNCNFQPILSRNKNFLPEFQSELNGNKYHLYFEF